MKRDQLLFRKKLLFADSLTDFVAAKESFFEEVNALIKSGDSAEATLWLSDMFIDLQSFITEWKLDRWIDRNIKTELIDECRVKLEQIAPDKLKEAEIEVESIARCELMKSSRETLAGRFNVYWGHDQCDDIDFSLRRGASYTTSNPGKINAFRKEYPEEWEKLYAEARLEYPNADAVKMISVMTMKVVAMMARHTAPLQDATDGQYGFSSIQVCPKNWDNAKAMEDEVCFWYEAFKKELCNNYPNITFKVPATPAAVVAAKNINSKYARLRVCATSNFSTRQHIEFYEALNNRDPAALLVIVDVHLRTFAKPEFEAMGVDSEKYCKLLVSMIYRRCYELLRTNSLNIQINGAGIRDAQGVRNNFTTDMALPTTLTIMTGVVKDFDEHPQELIDAMHDTISEEDFAVLNRCKIFRQAYYPEEFPWDDVRSFPPYALMMDKFEEAYDENLAAMKERLGEK